MLSPVRVLPVVGPGLVGSPVSKAMTSREQVAGRGVGAPPQPRRLPYSPCQKNCTIWGARTYDQRLGSRRSLEDEACPAVAGILFGALGASVEGGGAARLQSAAPLVCGEPQRLARVVTSYSPARCSLALFRAVLHLGQVKALLWSERFSIDGSLIGSYVLQKGLQPL